MASDAVVTLRDVVKTYQMGEFTVRALDSVSIEIQRGEYVAIMGASGSGKSTLLNLLGCLDRPSSGSYLLNGHDVSCMDDSQLSDVRSRYLGFIFQSFNLIQQLNVLENIEVPLFYQGRPPAECRARSLELAARVGLEPRGHHRPRELSGGQQQRVAIARSLANDPVMILADEPTGNLDSHTEQEVLDLMDELNGQGKTIIIVTHSPHVAKRTHRTIFLSDGKVARHARL